eukprot:TRINITY_DN33866_c0_g1_i1.p1 TRINITY_DN33866_c0_g1~~TRINITY_DN33866_c0_g1_i1.p1  ORF type:complete len:173 (+),score=19.27 TRINITY_DN33866_c0_g1_i1:36-554(+)
MNIRSASQVLLRGNTRQLFTRLYCKPPSRIRTDQARWCTAASENTDKKEGKKKEPVDVSKLSLYGKMKHFGPPALFIYLVIHTIGFWLMFALVYCGLPVKGLLAQWLGGEEKLPQGPWAELGIALAVNKLFGPLQMLLTVAVVPRLAPVLKAWGPTQTIIRFITTLGIGRKH